MLFSVNYKKVLNALPTAVIVVDARRRVRYTNPAFRTFFPAAPKRTGSYRDVTACADRSKLCGFGKSCRGCKLRKIFSDVFETRTAVTDDVTMSVLHNGKERKISLRMRVLPLDRKRCLGIIESVYEQDLAQELNNAQDIQQRLLPAGKEAGGTPYAYMYIPCREIGGDLPDVYELKFGNVPNTFGVLADVSGKGIAAGMLSSFVRAGFDRSETSPARAIAHLNEKFLELNLDEKSYITIAAVRINPAVGQICYCMAGHNAPILLKSGRNVSEIEMASPPVSGWFGAYAYEDKRIPYSPHDILVLLTDGVTESRDVYGEQFGIERVEAILMECASAQQFIDRLQVSLKEFCGTFNDDLTAIAFDL